MEPTENHKISYSQDVLATDLDSLISDVQGILINCEWDESSVGDDDVLEKQFKEFDEKLNISKKL